ncbi:hypothetical protein CPB85DRAFT_684411 [Mucidula mucida]|nr:hypothetical protein CPB85DRAFT_684411 [Mucidula mucida]
MRARQSVTLFLLTNLTFFWRPTQPHLAVCHGERGNAWSQGGRHNHRHQHRLDERGGSGDGNLPKERRHHLVLHLHERTRPHSYCKCGCRTESSETSG